MLAAIPCDLTTQAYCNLPGAAYPWHAVRRFVHENQGLMKRMYGDVRHISVLRDEIINNEIDVEDIEIASDRYSRDGFNHRASKFMHKRDELENYKSNDVLREPHFRPVTTTTTTTTTSKPVTSAAENESTTDNNDEKTTYSSVDSITSSSLNNFTFTETNATMENNIKSKILEIEMGQELTTKTDWEKQLEDDATTAEDEEDEDVNIVFNSVYEPSNETFASQETFNDNIQIVDSPRLGSINSTIGSTVFTPTATATSKQEATTSTITASTIKSSTTLKPETVAERAPAKQRKPFIPSSQRYRPAQQLQKVESTISAKLKLKLNPTQATPSRTTTINSASFSASLANKTTDSTPPATPLTSTKTSPFKNYLNKNYNRYTTLNNNRYALPSTARPGSESLTPAVQSLKTNAELLLGEKMPKPVASITTPTVSGVGSISNKPVLKDSQLFQDTMKQDPIVAPFSARGV